MSDGIAGFFAVTTGPRVLRSRLIGATRPIRGAGRALAVIRGVRGTFPDDVLGGDLLAVLSPHLRALLEPATAFQEEPTLQRLARLLTREIAADDRRMLAPSASEVRRAGDRPAAAAGGREARRAAPAFTLPAAELAAAQRVDAATVGVRRRSTSFTPDGPLRERLRRYWQAERAAEHRRAAVSDLAGAQAARDRLLSAPPPSGSAPHRPVPVTEAELARELEAFVGGPSPATRARSAQRRDGEGAHETPTAWTAVPPGASEPVADETVHGGLAADHDERMRMAARRREVGRRRPGLSELAEDMAAILREQANRHGIDVP